MRLSSLQTESKREEFRRYLEGAGVLDAFTKGSCCCWLLTMSLLSLILSPAVLVGLYEEPEKPPDALEYPKYTIMYGRNHGNGLYVDVCI